MAQCLPDAIQAINSDVAHAGTLQPDIHKNHRDITQFQIVQDRFFHSERQYRNTIDSALQHSPYGCLHALEVMNGGGN
ncbi:MAG: hypothetical protein ACJ71Q_07755 [Terriglobales bacterium]